MNKYIFFFFGGVAALAVAGLFLPMNKVETTVGSASAVGSTFSTAKVAYKAWTLSNGATTTSLYNSDSSDRIIRSVDYTCSGVGTSLTAVTGTGLANLIFTAGTTSTDAPAVPTLGNSVFSSTVATTVPEIYLSSTTHGLTTSAFVRRWGAGTYLTFVSNATNTAACVIGVTYMPN